MPSIPTVIPSIPTGTPVTPTGTPVIPTRTPDITAQAPVITTQTTQTPSRPRTIDTGLPRNTALVMPCLRYDVTCSILLRSLHGIGRVRFFELVPVSDEYPIFSIANIVFFTHEAALRLFQRSRQPGFFVQGDRVLVWWSPIFVPEAPSNDWTRVLRIEGPVQIVNREFLEYIWSRQICWQTDHVEVLNQENKATVWYYFACWEGQAEYAMEILLELDYPNTTVYYVRDPCGD
ncbi:hypothetical protein F5Y12DRAFT_751438 [Xylaria sp. FL1777]|nr:hypothetical protein F5Y12DRAFT_751438 [Xylaria sp. FL1777]